MAAGIFQKIYITMLLFLHYIDTASSLPNDCALTISLFSRAHQAAYIGNYEFESKFRSLPATLMNSLDCERKNLFWMALFASQVYCLRRYVFISLCYTQIRISSRNDFHRKLYGLLFSNRLGTYLAGFIIATRSNNLFGREKAIVRKQMAKQIARVGMCSGVKGIAKLRATCLLAWIPRFVATRIL